MDLNKDTIAQLRAEHEAALAKMNKVKREDEQRSKEWYEMRRGRFTASEIHKLMGIQGMGATGETYCFEKAAEIVFGIDEDDFTSWDMKRGIELEPKAFAKFKELKAAKGVEVKEAFFFPYTNDAGASPDGLVEDDACVEIKCPKPNKFFKLIKDGVKAIDKEYLWQMQKQMLASNSKRCYFFNYIIFNGVEMWHEIIVERDEAMIEKIKERLAPAVKLRNEFVQYLTEKKQF